MGAKDYFWRCCQCYGTWQSEASNTHCSDCGVRKCRHCEVQEVRRRRPGYSLESEAVAISHGQAKSKNKQEYLTQGSSKSSASPPSKSNDRRSTSKQPASTRSGSKQSFSTRPDTTQNSASSTLSLPYIGRKPTSIQGSPDRVDGQFFTKISAVGSPAEFSNLDEFPKVTDQKSVPKIGIYSNHNSEGDAPQSASSDRSLYQSIDAVGVKSPVPLSHSSWLIPLLHYPLYPLVVDAWAEVWSEDPVDQDSSTGNAKQSTPSSSGSTPDESDKRPSKDSRRKRKSDKKDEPGEAKKAKPSDSDNSSTAAEGDKRLACHFYKMNARLHLACMRTTFKKISALRQHLDQHHKLGTHHCSNCWTSFTGPAELERHLPRCKPTGIIGKPVDELPAVPKTRQNAPSKWYWIWEQMFPNFQKPDTPYTDAEHTLIMQFVGFLSERYVPTVTTPLGTNPSISDVIKDMRTAAQEWASLDIPSPTPTTIIPEDQRGASPAALQASSQIANMYGNFQSTELLANGSNINLATSTLMGSEHLNITPLPTESIGHEVHAPSGYLDELDATDGVTTYTEYGSGAITITSGVEGETLSTWDPENPLFADSSDRVFHEPFARGLTEAEHTTMFGYDLGFS